MSNTTNYVMDHSTTLCLACSSSLPRSNNDIFITACCTRPICPTCLSSNPRLARYNPCLACLGGVSVVSSKGKWWAETLTSNNIDGAVRDEDTFAIGDDEDEGEDEGDRRGHVDESASLERPPPYTLSPTIGPSSSESSKLHTSRIPMDSPSTEPQTPLVHTAPVPIKYYINSRDNLQGIALRFGVDGRELCRLNKLPPSTLSTTPHILHTRSFLVLPPSPKALSLSPAEDKEREQRRARERAEKRLQTLTKEVDWRVAKAYVAVADDPEEELDFVGAAKEKGSMSGQDVAGSRLEVMAVGRYLDDEQWEQEQIREGRYIGIQRLPNVGDTDKPTRKGKEVCVSSWFHGRIW